MRNLNQWPIILINSSQHQKIIRIHSAVDSGGAGGTRAPPEFGGSEKGRSLISACRSLAIKTNTPGFEKLSMALVCKMIEYYQKCFKLFSDVRSLHGWKFLGRSDEHTNNRPIFKIVWILVVLGSIGVASFFLTHSFTNFLGSTVMTTQDTTRYNRMQETVRKVVIEGMACQLPSSQEPQSPNSCSLVVH